MEKETERYWTLEGESLQYLGEFASIEDADEYAEGRGRYGFIFCEASVEAIFSSIIQEIPRLANDLIADELDNIAEEHDRVTIDGLKFLAKTYRELS